MQINLTNGKARLRLTKTEVRTLKNAQQILAGIGKFEPLHVAGPELEMVVKQINEDGEFVPSAEKEAD